MKTTLSAYKMNCILDRSRGRLKTSSARFSSRSATSLSLRSGRRYRDGGFVALVCPFDYQFPYLFLEATERGLLWVHRHCLLVDLDDKRLVDGLMWKCSFVKHSCYHQLNLELVVGRVIELVEWRLHWRGEPVQVPGKATLQLD